MQRLKFAALGILLGVLPLSSVIAMPSKISSPGERMVVVNPRIHEWGAYNSNGQLIRSGTAATGKYYCPDTGRGCKTTSGTFRVFHMGGAGCFSSRFPIPHGGAPMPYCMYYNGNQALHGSYEVAKAHLSHGCVRLHVGDAKWLRYNFVSNGTLVRVLPY